MSGPAVYGCDGCNTTGGRASCPIHGEVGLKPGWLERQFRHVQQNQDDLPEWAGGTGKTVATLRAQLAERERRIERLEEALRPFMRYHVRRMEVTNHALESVTCNGGVLRAEDWDGTVAALASGEKEEGRG